MRSYPSPRSSGHDFLLLLPILRAEPTNAVARSAFPQGEPLASTALIPASRGGQGDQETGVVFTDRSAVPSVNRIYAIRRFLDTQPLGRGMA